MEYEEETKQGRHKERDHTVHHSLTSTVTTAILTDEFSRISKALSVGDLIDVHDEEATVVSSPAILTQPGLNVLVVREKVGSRYAIAGGDAEVSVVLFLCLQAALGDGVRSGEGIVREVWVTSLQSAKTTCSCVEVPATLVLKT